MFNYCTFLYFHHITYFHLEVDVDILQSINLSKILSSPYIYKAKDWSDFPKGWHDLVTHPRCSIKMSKYFPSYEIFEIKPLGKYISRKLQNLKERKISFMRNEKTTH